MKRTFSKIIILIAAFCIIDGTSLETYAAEGYTYNYDWWGDIQHSPDAYDVVGVYNFKDLGLNKNLNNPAGLFVHGKTIYLCDTGNNRILEIERDDVDSFKLVRTIDKIYGDVDVSTLSSPTDISVSDDGYMYISDKGNGRILKLDINLNYIMEFSEPVDESYNGSLSFLPNKIVVDSIGRVYCIADNINKGLIKYESDGSFKGFTGANDVIYDWYDYIWKKLSTTAQRAASNSFVPTEYDNIYIDHEGFIYACTTNINKNELRSGDAKPIRKLNMLGKNILIENGNYPVYGDLYWGEAGGYKGPSLIKDITSLDNGVYFGLDNVRGRLFAYDNQGNLLYAFGGSGNMDGFFKDARAIEHMGLDIIVLDSQDNSFTVFTPTEFGDLIYKAIDEYTAGEYDAAGETWKRVLMLDGNYDLAYKGIGKSLLRQGEYLKAMKYFKLKYDSDNYSKSFKQFRKIWIEEHIVWIFIGFFVIISLPLAFGRLKKIKIEIDNAEIFKE
ncbi:MAG TPA: hypothetical protein VJZ04_02565 [Lachnospiraceae bacterium]|nr:hypothetical protein [Lachnospiraceae bacterium]